MMKTRRQFDDRIKLSKEQIIAASKANNEPQQLIDSRLSARELMEKLRLPRMQRFDFRTWPLIAERPLKWVESDADLVENQSPMMK